MFNPGGSVKDRIGVAMIEAAEKEGRIEPGRTTIVEATSGNTGIALAFVCAAKGYELILTLPQGMSREREGLLRLYGAQVHITESMGGMNEAVAAARAMARDHDVFLPDQFSNPANPEVHRRTTGPELWEAMDGKIDYLVAGVGTGGTITGAGSFLKERDKDIKVIAVEPATSAGAVRRAPRPAQDPGHRRGLRPAGAASATLLDEIIAVDDEDAIETARLAARREGVLCGISCGAALWARARDRRAPRGQGQADRGRAARQRRALRLHAVLRSRADPARHDPRGRRPRRARRGSGRCTATLDRLVVESDALAGNPLGDPSRRPLYVYRPPGVELDHPKPLPSVYVIQGFTGQLDMWFARQAFEPTMIERLDAMFAAGDCPDAIVVFVDAWTSFGGSQFLNSTGTGRYLDYLCDEVVAVRRRALPDGGRAATTAG